MQQVYFEITINQFSDGNWFTKLLSESQFLITTAHSTVTKNWFDHFGDVTSLQLFRAGKLALRPNLPYYQH